MGTLNFKNKAGYHKWLAYGHMHGDFAKAPGNMIIKIAGQWHKVVHGGRKR